MQIDFYMNLIMPKLTHDDLIELGLLLDYLLFEDGICQGFVLMLSQAILAEDEKNFFKRLHLIESYLENFKNLITAIKEAKDKLTAFQKKIENKEKINQENLLTEEDNNFLKMNTDLRAFFDGIELYLSPEKYPELFNGTFVHQQNLENIYSFAKSIDLENSDLTILFDKPYVFTQDSVIPYLKDLANVLSQTDLSLPILIDSGDHTICLKYNKNNQTWLYVDIGDFERYPEIETYFRELTDFTDIASSIFESLGDTSSPYIVFNTIVLAKENHTESLKIAFTELDEKYPIKPEQVNQYDSQKMGLLYLACKSGQFEIVHNLLSHGSIDLNKASEDGTTPLYIACQNGHLKIVKELLNQKIIDINKATNDDVTPLDIACHQEHFEIVEELLRRGAKINDEIFNATSIFYSACSSTHSKDQKTLFNLLLLTKNIDSTSQINEKTALDMAFENNNTAAISAILKFIQVNKIDVSTVMSDLSLRKAFMWSKENDNFKLKNYLLKKSTKITLFHDAEQLYEEETIPQVKTNNIT